MQINGPALIAIRERSGFSQNQLAKASGVAQGRISTIESSSADVRPATAMALAKALAVPVSAILARPIEATA